MLMRQRTQSSKLRWLMVVGAICMGGALIAGTTICPIVKRIWTPSFALFSAAWTVWMLAAFYWLIEIRGWRRWTFPLVVVGMNSIAIYLMTLLWPGWITRTLRVHFGSDLFTSTYGPIWLRCTIVIILWSCCYWLYRRKIFLRV
jgi:predicted acyltransferase